jgi:anti-sigma factor RsiW
MKPDSRQPDPAPTPDDLVAYADDALDAPDRRRVESWLADNPDVAAEVADWGRIDRWMEATRAPEPPPAAWDAVRERLDAALPDHPTPAAAPPLRRAWPWVAAVAGLAAAVLVLVLARSLFGPRPADPAPTPEPGRTAGMPQRDEDERRVVQEQTEEELTEIPLLSHEQVTLNERPDPDMRLEMWGTPMIVDPQLMKDP